MKNFLPAILVPLSVLLAGCNTWILENPDPGEPCVNIDPAAMPGGIWLGMKPKDARRILGDPLREVLLDFTGSGSSLTRLRYEGFMLESSDRAGNKIGLFEWTKPGTGPNSELLLGGPEPRIPHHTIVYSRAWTAPVRKKFRPWRVAAGQTSQGCGSSISSRTEKSIPSTREPGHIRIDQ